MISENLTEYLVNSTKIFSELNQDYYKNNILKAADLITKVATSNKTILICGNGGSAADSMHIAGELTGRFMIERRAIKAVALSADSSIITALANDYGFEEVFARQVEALGERGGVLWVLTTSGKSNNIIAAADVAKKLGMVVVAMTGAAPSVLDYSCNVTIKIPSLLTPLIQQAHQLIYHFICRQVEIAVSESEITLNHESHNDYD